MLFITGRDYSTNYFIRRLAFLLMAVLALNLFVTSFVAEGDARKEVEISVPVSANSLPAFYLQENSDMNVEVLLHRKKNVVVTRLLKGEVDMALLATNEAAKLFNKDAGIRVVNVNTWGVFYLLTRDPEISSWEDLSGKEMYLPKKGNPMDVIFSYVARAKGVDPTKELGIQRGRPRQMSKLMINGMVETAVLREPFVSRVMLEEPSVRIGLNLQSGWKSATDMRLPQAVLAVKQDLAEENPELVEKFNSQYGEAINWVNDNGEQAAEMAKKFMDTPFKVTKRSMPRINLIFARAREVKPEITRYLELLMEANKKSIGGRVPGEKFYF
mgnify:CR=1 FL=1